MKEQSNYNLIGDSTTPATLTAAYAGNVTNKQKVERADEMNLEVSYTPGATNQYVEILIETSADGTNWKNYPYSIAGTSEEAVYANPIVVPGDKTSLTTASEEMGVSLSLNFIWLRVSAREKTSAGGTPSAFGTVWINCIIKYDL